MILTSELRIGNKYFRKHGKGWTEITMDEDLIGKIFSTDLEFALQDFEPIPLDHNKFIWMGFKRLSCKEIVYKIGDSLSIERTDFESWFVENHWRYIYSTYPSHCPRNVRLDFVHQVQNLHFIIEKSELIF